MRQKGEERELDGARVGEEGDGSEVLPREYQGALQLVVVAVAVRVVVVVRVPQLVFRLLCPSPSLTRCHSLHRLGGSLAGVFRLVFVLVFVRVFVLLFQCQRLFLCLRLRQPVLPHLHQSVLVLVLVLLFQFLRQRLHQSVLVLVLVLSSPLHQRTSPLLPGAPLAGVFLGELAHRHLRLSVLVLVLVFLFLHRHRHLGLSMLMLVLLRLRLFIRLFLLPCQLQPVLSLRLLLRPRQLQHQLFSSLPPASGPRALFSSLPRERRGHWPGQGHARLSSRYGG